MGFEVLLIPFAIFGGLGLVAMLVPVAISRGRTWWVVPLFGVVGYSSFHAMVNANEGWKLLSFFATQGILYLVMAFCLAIGSLLLLPFKPQLVRLLNRISSFNTHSRSEK